MKARQVIPLVVLIALVSGFSVGQQAAPKATITAIKAGRLIDPETGTVAAQQVILIEGEKISKVGRTCRSRRARRSSISPS